MDDYRLELTGTQINNILSKLVAVGTIWMSTDANFDPAASFGGTWTLVGTRLTIDNRVYGNGKGLGLFDGTTNFALQFGRNGVGNYIPYGYSQDFNTNVGTESASGLPLNSFKTMGIPTKAQISSLGTGYEDATGLTTDYITCYIWQRTA